MRGWRDGRTDLTVWEDAAGNIDICDDDTYIHELVVDVAAKLANLTLNNVNVETITDARRRAQLDASGSGKKVGVGEVHFSNACLADSLLQTLAVKHILPRSLLEGTAAAKARRSQACIDARQHLVDHEDYTLHPRVRDDNGVVVDFHVDHDNAYLEHNTHSEALIMFFLDFFRPTHAIQPCGFKLVVYARFDSDVLPPDEHVFGVGEEVPHREAPVVLELYNNTGTGFTGFHYDPVFLITEHNPSSGSSVEQKAHGTSGGASSSKGPAACI